MKFLMSLVFYIGIGCFFFYKLYYGVDGEHNTAMVLGFFAILFLIAGVRVVAYGDMVLSGIRPVKATERGYEYTDYPFLLSVSLWVLKVSFCFVVSALLLMYTGLIPPIH